eukprot:Clim_evm65s134 gene=Clim_evmTU65s134
MPVFNEEYGGGGDSGRAGSELGKMTLPAVLTWIQYEFARFEREKAEWDLERSGFLSRISMLEGERKAQEGLKRDLIRRVKMLEYAIMKERKDHAAKMADLEKEGKVTIAAKPEKEYQQNVNELIRRLEGADQPQASYSLKTTSQLRQYLRELGYTDEFIRAARMPEIPQRTSQSHNIPLMPSHLDENGASEEYNKEADEIMNAFDEALNEGTKDDDVGDDQEDIEDESPLAKLIQPQKGDDGVNDAIDASLEAKYDSNQLNKIMRQYKKGQQKATGRPAPKTVKNVFEGLTSPLSPKSKAANEEEEAVAGLDELLSLEMDSQPTEEKESTSIATTGGAAKNWKPKVVLKGHVDGVRTGAFMRDEPVLLSGSEDCTVKFWRLDDCLEAESEKKIPGEMDAVVTLRSHVAPVLSSCIAYPQNYAFTGDLDGNLVRWDLQRLLAAQPYEKYDHAWCASKVKAHEDALWCLTSHPAKDLVASSGADGVINIWTSQSEAPIQRIAESPDTGQPTSCSFLHSRQNMLLISFDSGMLRQYDLETGQMTEQIHVDDEGSGQQINCAINHPTMPIIITGHEDKKIRYFDINSSKCISSTIAHQDAVTGLAFDLSQLYVISTGHDCSVRTWDLGSRTTCVQEISAHKMRFDEGILGIQTHPSKVLMTTYGADASIKLYL